MPNWDRDGEYVGPSTGNRKRRTKPMTDKKPKPPKRVIPRNEPLPDGHFAVLVRRDDGTYVTGSLCVFKSHTEALEHGRKWCGCPDTIVVPTEALNGLLENWVAR